VNFLDLGILLIFAFFLLAGWYRGFFCTLLSIGAYTLSCGLALILMPVASNLVKNNAKLYTMALYYAEGGELVRDVELSKTAISSLSSEQLSGIMESANLPLPMGSRISENIAREAFAKDSLTTLGEYFNQTIVNVFINILCVLLVFIVLRLLFAFVINLIRRVFRAYSRLFSYVYSVFACACCINCAAKSKRLLRRLVFRRFLL